ncbi:serine/threonine-protein kinase [Jannaschia seohaensis]|uniref:Serine/threonine protein kinase n=1 Tax=Jannaschia seohaensis TaxID=475081 RepID=A0A2Y9API4_9RHOB|nr:protein kinase [Jannaschia seohaensis]PWJ19344.1 serine/threonine protein kinase [Jannaschia seohaensis]SSA46006.1 Serine/threonine protein kinase [Jannaschia seohaensis]
MEQEPALATDAASPMADELQPGTKMCQGQYTVLRYINSGGFGVTYLAHDSLGRKVVIKECFPGSMCCRRQGKVRLRSVSNEVDFGRVVELFEREARALAQLSHPNVVGVHQIFKENGTAYMAMDFVEGPDLFDVLETTPDRLGPDEVRRLLDQLLKALAYVHENGILHRDISPDNILLAPNGMPVLIDFGAARQNAARATRMLSRIHTVKDGYSPQEFYLAGSSQRKSSDLYALAATFHHLIRGCPPPNSTVRLAAVAQNDPDPYQPLAGRIPSYDDAFLAAIDKCLNLFAKDRMKSAEEWLQAISGAPASTPAPAGELGQDLRRQISELVRETAVCISQSRREPEAAIEVTRPDPIEIQRAKEREHWAKVTRDLEEIRAEIEAAEALRRETEEADARRRHAQGKARHGPDHQGRRAASKARTPSRFGQWVAGFLTLRRDVSTKPALQPQED